MTKLRVRPTTRNFGLFGSTSAVLLLSLVGCNNPPPAHLVDAHVVGDTGPGPVDMGVVPNDTNVMTPDTNVHTGACTYGTGGCDLTDTSSCPPVGGTRQGCYPDAMAPACHDAGSALAGASCANANDCDAGNVCLATNVCAALCCANSDCAPGETCNPLGDGMGGTLPNGVGVCRHPTSCTPIPDTGCMTAQHCIVTSMDGSTDCAPTGTAAEGASCTSENCVSGTGCYSTSMTAAVCYRFCRLGMGTTSNPDCTTTGRTTCHPAGLGTTYGICDA